MTASDTNARVRVALVGMGRMGRALDALADAQGFEVVARLWHGDTSNGITAAQLNGADVAIEFTQPDSALENVRQLLAAGCPVVVGTTGFRRDDGALEALVANAGVPALWAPNFSIGVQLFLRIAEDAARRLRAVTDFDAHVIETHHAAKKDAPSGTGLALAERLERGLGHSVPITSVRTGYVPGTHEIVFDAMFEQISLRHEARNRDVFARGALLAAGWLAAQRTAHLYSMSDVVDTLLADSHDSSSPSTGTS